LKLSLVIPVLNEEQALPFTLARLRSVLAEMDCEHEIFFVNDGSTDGTSGILAAESAGDRRIKVIHFSRNFGHQAAVTAGLDFATGDAVVIMDADLQDPPELLPAMIALYRGRLRRCFSAAHFPEGHFVLQSEGRGIILPGDRDYFRYSGLARGGRFSPAQPAGSHGNTPVP